MYCENCGQNYASVKYTQIINGNQKEMFLCKQCSKLLGIGNLNMPIDFSTFLGNFFTEFEEANIPSKILNTKQLKCKRCGYTFEDFIETGRFGCPECYQAFEEKIDSLLSNLQGANRHVGRLGSSNEQMESKLKKSQEEKDVLAKDSTKLNKIKELREQLKIAIKKENYEEAASLRDQIKELEGEQKC